MRRLLSVALLLVVVVFTAQNADVTELRFLGWSFVMSRSVIIFLALVVGILIGWLTPWRRRHEPAAGAEGHEQPQER